MNSQDTFSYMRILVLWRMYRREIIMQTSVCCCCFSAILLLRWINVCKPITSDFDVDRRIKTPSSDLAQTITCLNSCACSLQIPQPHLITCYWWCAVFNAFYSVCGRYRDVESAEGGRSSRVPAPSSKPCSLRPKEMAHVLSNKMLVGYFWLK